LDDNACLTPRGVIIHFNKSKIKGKRWGKKKYERAMKKLEEKKLSHFMCYQCHEIGHLASACPNKEKLKLEKEEKKLKHVKCRMCDTLHFSMPNQESGEATRRATTKATR
jgi:hypothetical protein